MKAGRRRNSCFIAASIYLLFFVFSGLAAFGEDGLPEVIVAAWVDKPLALIGDIIRFTISVEYDEGYSITFPDMGSDIDGLAIKKQEISLPKKLSMSRYQIEANYMLETFVAGPYIISSKKINAVKENNGSVSLETSQIFVEIRSLLGDKDDDIRDIKPPFYSKNRIVLYVLAALLIFAVALGLVFILKARRKKITESVMAIPLHEIALRELSEVRSKDLLSKGFFKEFYTLVSDILRRYIEGRFSIKATEQTTEEFLDDVLTKDVMSSEKKLCLQEFLSECDLVKFARYAPGSSEADRIFKIAYDFIQEAKQTNEEHSQLQKVE